MARAKGMILLQSTISEIHKKKLEVLASRLGISKSGAIQRLIEQADLFEIGQPEKEEITLLSQDDQERP